MCRQGADGSYGTSLSYATAMDPACDVMLAYKQNGRTLAPDHGFPIRMIIPGHIGTQHPRPLASHAPPRTGTSFHPVRRDFHQSCGAEKHRAETSRA